MRARDNAEDVRCTLPSLRRPLAASSLRSRMPPNARHMSVAEAASLHCTMAISVMGILLSR